MVLTYLKTWEKTTCIIVIGNNGYKTEKWVYLFDLCMRDIGEGVRREGVRREGVRRGYSEFSV